ncbi:MAG: aminotransferase class V-fold PLP-dependent enzyme [Gemmatimonas sp.]
MPNDRRTFVASATTFAAAAITSPAHAVRPIPLTYSATDDPLGVRGDFPVLGNGRVFLNSAYITPSPRAVTEAGVAFLQSKAAQPLSVGQLLGKTGEVCNQFARLIKASPDEIGFVFATSEGENTVANNVPLAPGDNVVVDDLHYDGALVMYRQLEKRRVPFANAVQARWVAEDGIRRFRANIADAEKSPLLAQALVHAGFANRLLGETHCESVIDAGPAGSSNVYFERALKHFTEAIAVATAAGRAELATAALAGRASVKVGLKDWAGAAADAAGIPLAFKYQAKYTATELDQYNILYWANANSPFRTFSVVGTYYEGYFRDTGDPRVAWSTDPKTPNAELSSVKWLYPTKYRAVTDPINLVTGREARPIEAEAALRAGQTADALARLNTLRATVTSTVTGAPLAPWPATSDAAVVWRYLKLERGIELYLEGRRIGDLRRWAEDDSPAKDVVDVRDRIRLCVPLSAAELNANPHLDPNHVDPVNPLYVGR